MSKYTDGPWKYGAKLSGSENHRGFYVASSNRQIADINPQNDHEGNSTDGEANARLIAAAPELLDAAKAIIGMLTHEPGMCGSDSCPRCHMEAAIAKAEGHQTR